MSDREEMLKEYLAGFQSMDPERSLRAATPDFHILDGALEVPVSRVDFPDYMLGWDDRMKALGGTGRYEVSDEVVQNLDDCLVGPENSCGFPEVVVMQSMGCRELDDLPQFG